MLIGGMLVENPYYTSPDRLSHPSEAVDFDTRDDEIEEVARWYFDETIG